MKRTTVMLPEDMITRLTHESRRRHTSIAEIVREAVDHHLPAGEKGRNLSFFALGEGGPADGSERVDEFVSGAVEKALSEPPPRK